jgi:hypothetical protein
MRTGCAGAIQHLLKRAGRTTAESVGLTARKTAHKPKRDNSKQPQSRCTQTIEAIAHALLIAASNDPSRRAKPILIRTF